MLRFWPLRSRAENGLCVIGSWMMAKYCDERCMRMFMFYVYWFRPLRSRTLCGLFYCYAEWWVGIVIYWICMKLCYRFLRWLSTYNTKKFLILNTFEKFTCNVLDKWKRRNSFYELKMKLFRNALVESTTFIPSLITIREKFTARKGNPNNHWINFRI